MYRKLIGFSNLGPRNDSGANCLGRVSHYVYSARHGLSDGTKRAPADTLLPLLNSLRRRTLAIAVRVSSRLFLICRWLLVVACVVANCWASLKRLALFGTRLVLI